MPSTAQAKEFTDAQRFAAEAWRATDKLYYERTFGGADWFARAATIQQATDAESARGAVDGLLRKLGDPYTRYVAPEKYEALVSAAPAAPPSSPAPACRSWTGTTGKSSSLMWSRARRPTRPRLRAGDEIQQVGSIRSRTRRRRPKG